jgi:hypothetical protein
MNTSDKRRREEGEEGKRGYPEIGHAKVGCCRRSGRLSRPKSKSEDFSVLMEHKDG